MKNIAVLCLAAASCAAVCVSGKRAACRPKALGEKVYKVKAQVLTIPAGKHRIHGELLLPEGMDGRLPTVIVSHGLNSSGKHTKNLIGMSLAMSGFAVICFDFYGGSRRSLSGGKMPEMTVFTEKEDLTAVLDYAAALESTDKDRLFLLGESQGGFVTAITAAEHPELRAIVLYYPAFCIPEDARARHGAKEKIPAVERFGPSRLGRAYSESVWDYDVYRVIGAYGGPVLILHGDHDKAVDISYGRRAKDVYRHAEFVCLPGEIHGFTRNGKRKAAELSYAFLQRVNAAEPRLGT